MAYALWVIAYVLWLMGYQLWPYTMRPRLAPIEASSSYHPRRPGMDACAIR